MMVLTVMLLMLESERCSMSDYTSVYCWRTLWCSVCVCVCLCVCLQGVVVECRAVLTWLIKCCVVVKAFIKALHSFSSLSYQLQLQLQLLTSTTWHSVSSASQSRRFTPCFICAQRKNVSCIPPFIISLSPSLFLYSNQASRVPGFAVSCRSSSRSV